MIIAAAEAPAGAIVPQVFVALLVVLASTLVCGSLALRVGQPRVVGEMVAGVLLGPSLFGWLLPAAQAGVFPAQVSTVLNVLSQLGLVLFMFLVGAGLHAEAARGAVVRGAVTVGVAGVALPFVLGFGLAWVFADVISPPGTPPVQVALLLGAALSVTAFPMLARILAERRMEHTALGSTALLAASVDDAVAWVLLAAAAAVASGGSGAGVLLPLGGSALLVVVLFRVVRPALAPLVRSVERRQEIGIAALVALLILMLLSAIATEVLGLHLAFGAFLAGAALPRSAFLCERLRARLTDVTVGLLLPLFFVHTGLQTDLLGLAKPTVLLPVLLVLVAAFVGKYAGCTLALRLQGHPWRRASAVGGLMNARGLMVLIFAQVASDLGVISVDLFSILVLIGVITTAVAMPIYRLSLPPAFEDAEREAGPSGAGAGHTTEEGLDDARNRPRGRDRVTTVPDHARRLEADAADR